MSGSAGTSQETECISCMYRVENRFSLVFTIPWVWEARWPGPEGWRPSQPLGGEGRAVYLDKYLAQALPCCYCFIISSLDKSLNRGSICLALLEV